jgi:hypothetical protein
MGVRLLAAGPARIASEDGAAAGSGGDGPLALDLDAGEGVDGRSGSDPVAACPRTWMLGSSARNRQSNGTRALQQVVRPAQRLPISKRQSARLGMRMTWSALTCRRRWRSRRVELPALLEDGEVAFGV